MACYLAVLRFGLVGFTVSGRFKRGHLWALLKGPFWVSEKVRQDLARFEALSSTFLSALDPVGALAPFGRFSLEPKR